MIPCPSCQSPWPRRPPFPILLPVCGSGTQLLRSFAPFGRNPGSQASRSRPAVDSAFCILPSAFRFRYSSFIIHHSSFFFDRGLTKIRTYGSIISVKQGGTALRRNRKNAAGAGAEGGAIPGSGVFGRFADQKHSTTHHSIAHHPITPPLRHSIAPCTRHPSQSR